MSKYLYDDFIINLSKRITSRLNEISADYNFDYGDEYEIAICELLREFLPTKYGVCRGFVVNKAGQKFGDDIIIYDQVSFPTLKSLNKNDWARKENIPIEAVYCYIEAKYSLDISENPNSNLSKALKQISDVKSLVNEREKYELNKYDPYHFIPKPLNPVFGIPPYRNPIFSLIVSRYVKNGDNRIENLETIKTLINKYVEKYKVTENSPEGIVVGQDNYIFTAIKKYPNNNPTRFIIPYEENIYQSMQKDSNALAIALVHLYAGIDWIRLDKMPWEEIFNDIKNK
ncbi:conserved hypothetical protein [Formosa agariphila KMM 3901]|uniref:DUF6602 domain-containing protein n=1 Tax=Formosa agariphila (strain DSM 15362 / KCTC 12365 / LMG 23005 / KMM 3901 / M-2Alg 35-1) TaxID=1347342 RepID=T2KLJ1_FORAG|nr:DUF6602 domain-containing protein [Formosa agariphila]CDF79298.1 conserved hypothetical protein [Formosa agariphila KMM 3901]